MRDILIAGVLMLAVTSCSTTHLPYPPHYPLQSGYFLSRDSMFTGRIPEGWFYSSEDTLAPACSAWLVKDDFSATVTVRDLHLNELAAKQVEKEGLELLARISIASQRGNDANADSENKPTLFTMRGRDYCGFELTEQGVRKRVVVFGVKERYYECTALPVKGKPQSDDVAKMFSAQQAFLNSLTF